MIPDQMIVTSDGGYRGVLKGSASAFIVWALDFQQRRAQPIALSYSFWRNGRSAFEAEIVALDRAVQHVARFYNS